MTGGRGSGRAVATRVPFFLRSCMHILFSVSIEINTAWKLSVFGVILVRIFPHSNWIRTRVTPNKDTFYAVKNVCNLNLLILCTWLFELSIQIRENITKNVKYWKRWRTNGSSVKYVNGSNEIIWMLKLKASLMNIRRTILMCL